jgi:spermidine synthase
MGATISQADVATGAKDQLLLRGVFFISGFAAILYQLVWQRTLFALIGINIEAVTLIVTAFILGLGLGSLVGGRLSHGNPRGLVLRFAVVELAIGIYGLLSLRLLQTVGAWTLGLSPATTAFVTLVAVLPPTMAMGATLPILVAYYVRRFGAVGTAVAGLYFTNTLGSALAAFAASFVVIRALGLTQTVWLGAAGNFLVATVALIRFSQEAE